MIALSPDPIDPAALLDRFARLADGAGAIVSFTGVVRSDDGVAALWLDHHERMTIAAFDQLAAELRARFDLAALAIVHRTGTVAAGAAVVFVAAAAAHRRAAFDAVDCAMDRLKTAVPLWKREVRPAGDRWVEPRAADAAAAARWDRDDG